LRATYLLNVRPCSWILKYLNKAPFNWEISRQKGRKVRNKTEIWVGQHKIGRIRCNLRKNIVLLKIMNGCGGKEIEEIRFSR